MKRTKRSVAALLTVLMLCSMITIVFPASAVELDPESTPYGGVNTPESIVASNVFSSKTEAEKVFQERKPNGSVGSLSSDVQFIQEDGEDVMVIPCGANVSTTWVHTTAHTAYESYTVSFDICTIAKPNSTDMGNTGILLGTASNMGFPWHNMQFQYNAGGVQLFAVNHKGSAYGYTDSYSTPILAGSSYKTTPMWYNIRIESTREGTKFYFNNVLLPQAALDKLPKSNEITYIGFYPAGSTSGFKVRNFEIYEGVDLDLSLVPDNLFYSSTTAATYFKNVSTTAADYTVENGEYVMRVPIVNSNNDWVYTPNLPSSGSYTVEFDFCPMTTNAGALGSVGILLGMNKSNYRFPWWNMQLQFNNSAGVRVYQVYHTGSAVTDVLYSDPVLSGSQYSTTAQWYKVRFEVTPEGTKMYVNGAVIADEANSKLPGSGELKYLGLYPAGGTNGFKVKNFNIYEGVTPQVDNLIPGDLFHSFDTAQAWFDNISQDAAHYTVENGEAVMRVPLVDGGSGWVQSSRSVPYESYTVSYDFALVPKNASTSQLGGAGHLVGTGNRLFYSLRFDANPDTGKLQFRIVELDKNGLAVKEDNGYIKTNIDFSAKKWFNLKYEVTKDSFKIFLDGEEIHSAYMDGKVNSGNIKFYGFFPEGGTAGFNVKDLSVTEGVEAEIKAAVPELKEAITLHMQADIDTDSTEPVRMKFNFKGETVWADGVKSGTQYTFSLPDILPQDMGERISAQLYIGDVLKDTVSDYSMKQYCMNQLAATTDEDTELRALLVSILNYGAAAQEYFGKNVNDLATKDLSDEQKAYLSDYDISQAAGVITDILTGTPDADHTWNAATLGLYDLIKVRFKFTATDIANTRIKIGDVIYDAEDFAEAAGGKYFVLTEGVYATDFDKTITAMFIDANGNQIGEKVEYSVNTYLSYINGLQDSGAKEIVQALYNYGVASGVYENR